MNGQPNRLAAEGGHRFAGSGIDRDRPIQFRLDGRLLHGFVGDTVLTAALASGVIGAGTRGGQTLALDHRLAPPILLRTDAGDPARALPMERTPALDGLDFLTLAAAQRSRPFELLDRGLALFADRRQRLNARYDGDGSIVAPWLDLAPQQALTADLAVIGGGLAGMAAAVAAAKRGQRVVLVERRQALGGDAAFFGGTEREDPEAMIARLTAAVAGLAPITVLTGSEAFALFEGVVRIHQVGIEAGMPVGRGITLAAPRIVVANGVVERLPIFAGNRRPGVVGALEAFDRARRFGVWIGRRAMLATATSPAYRLATQARDAGVEFERIADSRLDAQSRFIEFSKALGIPLLRAMRPLAARGAERGSGLKVSFGGSVEGMDAAVQSFAVDQLVVAGGWQPDLTLWHMAGGASRWSAERTRLEAEGSVSGIVLAGAVAGFATAAACIGSGEAAVAQLFGRSASAVEDVRIDPLHESPDDPTPVAAYDATSRDDAFLDGGTSFARRPAPRAPSRRFWPGRGSGRALGEYGRPLGVADVAAGVQLGLIPAAEAAIVAQERSVSHGDIIDAGRRQQPNWQEPEPGGEAPPFLAGRFGPKPALLAVEPADGRRFEIGCLVYASADRIDPLAAIGVVFSPTPNGRSGGLALIARRVAKAGDRVTVRDISGAVAAVLIDPAAPPAAEAAVRAKTDATPVPPTGGAAAPTLHLAAATVDTSPEAITEPGAGVEAEASPPPNALAPDSSDAPA